MMLDLSPIKELTAEVRALRKEMAILIVILQSLSENPNTPPLSLNLILKEKEKKQIKPSLD